jgi:group I intron endonuclease
MLGVYKITSPTNKIYIGQSSNIESRKYGYQLYGAINQPKLHRSLKKYGWEKHIFEILHILPEDTNQNIINIYEVFYWQQYKDCGFYMLNVKEPGSNGKHSIETRKKIGASLLGEKNGNYKRDFSKEHRKKIGDKSKLRSKESNNKIREAQLGNKSHLGKKHNQKTIEILRERSKGNKNMLGKYHTTETKELIRQKSLRKIECPYCKKIGGIGIMKRWHFDHCKDKLSN